MIRHALKSDWNWNLGVWPSRRRTQDSKARDTWKWCCDGWGRDGKSEWSANMVERRGSLIPTKRNSYFLLFHPRWSENDPLTHKLVLLQKRLLPLPLDWFGMLLAWCTSATFFHRCMPMNLNSIQDLFQNQGFKGSCLYLHYSQNHLYFSMELQKEVFLLWLLG